jgi:hypothetical protein
VSRQRPLEIFYMQLAVVYLESIRLSVEWTNRYLEDCITDSERREYSIIGSAK